MTMEPEPLDDPLRECWEALLGPFTGPQEDWEEFRVRPQALLVSQSDSERVRYFVAGYGMTSHLRVVPAGMSPRDAIHPVDLIELGRRCALAAAGRLV